MNKPKHSSTFTQISKDDRVLSASDTAAEFNPYFGSVFTKTNPLSPHLTCDTLNCVMDDISIILRNSSVRYRSLRSKFGATPWWYFSQVIEEDKTIVRTISAALLQQSIDKTNVPNAWKLARVIPIFTSCDPSELINYRPISFTRMPCKLLEHIISLTFIKYLMQQNYCFS